jgi:hypothetical protein
MGQGLHRSARATEAVRRVIPHSQASLGGFAKRNRISPKAAAK